MGNKIGYYNLIRTFKSLLLEYECRLSFNNHMRRIEISTSHSEVCLVSKLQRILKPYPWFYCGNIMGYIYVEEINPYGTKIVQLYEDINGKCKK